jgi:L-ascorbate metabolism protein UlaG (beta-lactamase superfamily)
MKITHFGHACLLVETGDARLLFDPGTDSSGFEDLRDLTAILITHEHDDHVDYAKLPALIAANPGVVLVADRDTAAKLDGARSVESGDALELGGVTVDVVGGSHERIYQNVPDCTNAGYLVNGGAFYHSGDSYFVPDATIDILALPTSGPWLKLGDAITFLHAVGPRVAIPMHEAQLAHTGLSYGMIGAFKPDTTDFVPLDRGVARDF